MVIVNMPPRINVEDTFAMIFGSVMLIGNKKMLVLVKTDTRAKHASMKLVRAGIKALNVLKCKPQQPHL